MPALAQRSGAVKDADFRGAITIGLGWKDHSQCATGGRSHAVCPGAIVAQVRPRDLARGRPCGRWHLEDPSSGRSGAPLLAAGTLLAGRFRIVARLGEGAIGEVYEAADLELEEQVAVKVLRPGIARDGEVLQRFKREIQLARKVTHPNVCRTFELFHHGPPDDSGLTFVTMELLRGESLEERLLRAGRLAPAEALALLGNMADGLHAAHLAGVVHRDFKSGNVMLVPSPEGTRAVVTDFGLAWSHSVSVAVTRTGTLVGSPAYMAPEQVRGEAVSPATDVYALGLVLYEMVTGSLPFSADTAIATAIKRLREPPTLPRVHAPDLDRAWEAVILRCLEADPAARFATAPEVVLALLAPQAPRRASLQPPGAVPMRQTGPSRRGGFPVAQLSVAAVAVLFALAVAGWLARDRLFPRAGPPPSPPVAPAPAPRPAVAVLGFENLSRNPGFAYVESALVRMLPAELAVGERLRLVPGEQVDRARRDLGLAGSPSFARDTLERLRARLGADYVVTGSYLAGPRKGQGRIRCDVTVQDVRSGEIVASFTQEVAEESLLDLIDGLGVRLRQGLGVDGLSPAEQQAALAARPASPRAARLYAEGLEKLSRFETLPAAHALEEARDADPGNPLIRADLAAAWSALGYQARAEEAAQGALDRAAGLGFEPHRRVEARLWETRRQWGRAAALYRELWRRLPDDLETGLDLARVQIQGGEFAAALATTERLRGRTPRPPQNDDPRIDCAEAEAALRHADLARGIAAAGRALRKGEAQGAPLVIARALFFQGTGLRLLGRLPEARAAAERAGALFRKAGDLASVAQTLNTVGSVQQQQGDLAGAGRTFDEIIAIGNTIGSDELRGLGLTNQGVLLSNHGDLSGARQRYMDALAIFRAAGSKVREAMTLGNLARVQQRLGERAAARTLYEDQAATFQEIGDRSSEARVLANLADLLIEEGDLAPATAHADRALALHQEIGEASGVAEARGVQGQILALRGDLPGAERELTAAADGLDALGSRLAAARRRIELAQVLVDAGRPAEAEGMTQQALASMGRAPAAEDEVAARSVRAAAALVRGNDDVATAEIRRTAEALGACENRAVRLRAVIVKARVHAAAGREEEAFLDLRAAQAEAERMGLRPLALEARLARGQLEGAGGRADLAAVAREAAAAGLGNLARRAQAGLARAK